MFRCCKLFIVCFLSGWNKRSFPLPVNLVSICSRRLSPLQEGSVGVRHHFPLGLSDEVSPLFVWDGPTLLDLTQLLQAVVEALKQKQRKYQTVWRFLINNQLKKKINKTGLTLNLSLITCRSLSFSCRKIDKDKNQSLS